MVNCRARIGLGAPRLAACKEVCLDCLPDADCRPAKLAGYRSARVEPADRAPKQNTAGCPAPSNGPPRKEIPTFPVNTCINNGRAKTGTAHPIPSQRPFLLASSKLPSPPTQGLRIPFECCTSCDQVAVSAAARDCALLPRFPCPCFRLHLLVDLRLFLLRDTLISPRKTNPRDEPVRVTRQPGSQDG